MMCGDREEYTVIQVTDWLLALLSKVCFYYFQLWIAVCVFLWRSELTKPLELELQRVVSYHAGAKNQTCYLHLEEYQVLFTLSYLSKPLICTLCLYLNLNLGQ